MTRHNVKISLMFALLLPSIIWAQNASDYLPARIGSTYRYQRFTLDSLQRQIASSKRIETDSLAGTQLVGAARALVFRNLTNALRDSVIVNVHGDTVAFFNGGYPKENLKLLSDSLGLGFLPQVNGWYAYVKFKSPPLNNRVDTLYQHDSTITVDGAEFNLRLTITRKRYPSLVGTEPVTVTVPAGTFPVTPFEIILGLLWRVWTPLGERGRPLLNDTTQYYIAAGNWIVKEVHHSSYFPLTPTENDSIPKFSIPGYVRVLEKMTATSVPADGGIHGPGAQTPGSITLGANYPNPFNGATTIRFDLEKRSVVALRIYDVLGRIVWREEGKEMSEGAHRVQWEAGMLPSGVYYCRLDAGGVTRMNKMILQK